MSAPYVFVKTLTVAMACKNRKSTVYLHHHRMAAIKITQVKTEWKNYLSRALREAWVVVGDGYQKILEVSEDIRHLHGEASFFRLSYH